MTRARVASCAVFLMAAFAMFGGCDIFGLADTEPATIEVYPSELSLAPGDTAWLDYIVRDGRGKEVKGVSVRWQVPSNEVVSVSSNGRVIGYTPGMTRITATRDDIAGGASVAVGTIRFDNVRDLAIAAYRDKYGLKVVEPAIAPDSTMANAVSGLPINRPTTPTHFVSTVYGQTYVYVLEMWPDGRIQSSRFVPAVRPEGAVRLAVVVLDYPYTNFAELLDTHWRRAVDSMKADYRHWAESVGWSEPLLSLDVVTVVADSGEVSPLVRSSLKAYLAKLGIEYDVPAVINLDPHSRMGGLYVENNGDPWIYIGCFCPRWQDGVELELTPNEVQDIAYALFHHELGHAMGWWHSWGGGPPGTRLITNPAFFGWTDLTGDGWPEILSPTPYGAPRRFP